MAFAAAALAALVILGNGIHVLGWLKDVHRPSTRVEIAAWLALRDAAEALAIRVASHHAERGGSVVSIDRSGGQNKHLPVVN